MRIETKNLSFSYGAPPVLSDICFSADAGETIALLGANGAGKSTFFRCLLGFLHPQSGEVLLDGRSVASYGQKALARKIAYIPQSYSPTFDYTVRESVLMGMTAQLGVFDTPGREEEYKVLHALESLGIAHLAARSCRKISGGERQLMLLARALVQDAQVLLMDEPTASLDYGNSCRVMQRVQALGKAGYTVIFSTHDPNQALRYAGRVLAIRDGTLVCDGAPRDVVTAELLRQLYGIRVRVVEAALDGKIIPVLLPEEEGAL